MMIGVDGRPNRIFDESKLETSFWRTESHFVERSDMTTKVRIALTQSGLYVNEKGIQFIAEQIGECKLSEIPERIREYGRRCEKGNL